MLMQEAPRKPENLCPHCCSGQIHDAPIEGGLHQAFCALCGAQGPIKDSWKVALHCFCNPYRETGVVTLCLQDAEYILKCMKEDRKAWDRMHGGRDTGPCDAEQMLELAIRGPSSPKLRIIRTAKFFPKGLEG